MIYRITSGRWDVASSTYKEFDAPDDEAAKKTFKEATERKENSWDAMHLYRVDQSGKTTVIDSVRVRDGEGYANDL